METWKIKKNNKLIKAKSKKRGPRKLAPAIIFAPLFSDKEKYALRVALSVFLFEIAMFIFMLFFSNINSYASASVVVVKPGLATSQFINDLKINDLEPIINQKIKRASFSVEGILIGLGKDNIQVFEYPNRDVALAEEIVLSQKYTGTTTKNLWKSTKHIYVKDKIIVFYMGTEKNILDFLNARFLTVNNVL